MPVCDIFKPKLHYDQLCYETDLQELKSSNKRELRNQLELGLTLVLDYNEEKQLNSPISKNTNLSKTEFRYDLNNGNSVSMYLDTISILLDYLIVKLQLNSQLHLHSKSIQLIQELSWSYTLYSRGHINSHLWFSQLFWAFKSQ